MSLIFDWETSLCHMLLLGYISGSCTSVLSLQEPHITDSVRGKLSVIVGWGSIAFYDFESLNESY